MSFDFNYKFWVASKSDIDKLLLRQNELKRREPIDDPVVSFQILSQMFVLYAELATKLGYLYQNTFQVQKREVVRNLLAPILRTLMLLRNELKSLEFSEFVYVDNVLITRKLTPFNLVIWQSPNFLYRRPIALQNILYDNQLNMDEREREQINAEKKKIIEKALFVIQSHEKARQARVYRAAITYDRNLLKERTGCTVRYSFCHKKDQSMSIPVKRTMFNANSIKRTESCRTILMCDTIRTSANNGAAFRDHFAKREIAAFKIQRAWRIYKAKKQLNKTKLQRKLLYGIKKTRRIHKPDAPSQVILETYKNEIIKQKIDEDYFKLMTNERTRLLQERAPQIMEDISDHVRAWFREFYNEAGDFHPYPDVAKQGTVLVLLDESMQFEEFKEFEKLQNMSKEEKKARAEKLNLQKQKEKEKIKKQKLKEAKQRKKMKAAGIFDIAHLIETNKDIEQIEKTIKQYSSDWKNVDEYLNKHNEAIKEWVTENELGIIHRELRLLVDEYMRLEYELLKNAWALDKNKKNNPMKQKKPTNEKARRKKKLADPNEHRSIESLYQELKETGIIEIYPKKSFDLFIAEFNFLADDLRNDDHLV